MRRERRDSTDSLRRETQLRNNLECPAEEAPETISLAVRVEDETYLARPVVARAVNPQPFPHENWGSPESGLIGLS
jgi:hypothetical protein